MLTVIIPERELFDNATQRFTPLKGQVLQLEHSLVSLSKWESKWCKPFLGKEEITYEQSIDYIRCMTITQHVTPEAYICLPDNVMQQITDYINAPMTATRFNNKKNASPSREIITAEIIYYWMIAQNIPMECQKWHLNRLLTLIQVCNIKSQPPKKRGRKEMLSERTALNQARRVQFQTKG